MINVDKEIKVVIGAGEFINNPGWLHTQEDELNLLKKEQWQNMFSPDSVTAILAEHVWEHLTYEEGIEAAKICYEFLKPNGYIVYSYQTLTSMFESAGFKVKLIEYCDEHGEFQAVSWKPEDGVIYRSLPYDHRNNNGELVCVSLIVDAIKMP